MKKIMIPGILAIIALIVFTLIMSNIFFKELEKETNIYKQFLGKEVIINRDTLIITDFSVYEGTFIMNDGSSVNKELVKKLLNERNIKY